uniref:Uncharacterized protein n=1 Tax=Oryza sativa subsp. japonica TaxID=39947 RepID=Q6K2W4_ORYSJ|nr:hypothetical protein [Oryza sativa Japonica Group]
MVTSVDLGSSIDLKLDGARQRYNGEPPEPQPVRPSPWRSDRAVDGLTGRYTAVRPSRYKVIRKGKVLALHCIILNPCKSSHTLVHLVYLVRLPPPRQLVEVLPGDLSEEIVEEARRRL